jgi:general L-amino acid transport system permease protein
VLEFVRNTPLLTELAFWYFAIILQLPPVQSAANLYGSVLFSQSGIFLPGLLLSDPAGMAPLLFLAASIVLALTAGIHRLPRPWRLATAIAAFIGLAITIWIGFPLTLDRPVIGRFGASGGISISPEMAAILLAVTVNSGAYTAEIVRGAIAAIPKGQWEASAALGLSRRDSLRDIVLPQMFRIVLPSLGNRYRLPVAATG